MVETAKQVNPIWKCGVKNCDLNFPPTLHGYRQMQGHQLKHANEGMPKDKRGYHLADESTGEVLAQSINEAMPFLMVETPKESKKIKPPLKNIPPRGVPLKVPAAAGPTPQVIPELPEEPPSEPPEAALPEEILEEVETTKDTITTVKTPGIFTYEVTLPADAFTLFNLAKAYGLEPNEDKLFDEWLWDCIRARYSKDYKQQLVLAPLEE